MRFIEELKEKREIKKLEKYLTESGLQNGLKNKVLDLQHNWLGKLPNYLKDLERIIKNTKDLERLGLRDNELADLPEYITTLKELKILYLGFNKINTIPNSIGQLTKLEELDLEHNGISMILDSIGELKKLKKLELKNNRLTNIPETIGQLKEIEYINLDENQLTSIPNSLCELIKQKKELEVHLLKNKLKLMGLGGSKAYTILNNEYIYTDYIGNKIENGLVKHLSELTQEDLSHMLSTHPEMMINNYTITGVILTPKTAIEVINYLTGNDYTKHTTQNIYQEHPKQKDMINKIINICPTLRSIIPYDKQTMTKIGTEEYQELIL